MPRKSQLDEPPRLPFPLSDVSNGEWSPRPPTQQQIATGKRIAEEADRRARRLGLSRRDFLRTAAGTATAFFVMNEIRGLDSEGAAAILPVTREQCDDPEAGGELFKKDYFIVDVQLHHVDLEQFGGNPNLGCLRFLPQDATCTPEGLEMLSQANLIKEVFVDSETAVGVISGVPNGYPMPVATMNQTRNLVNDYAGSERALVQAMIDPLAAPGAATSVESMAYQVEELGARAIKCYTGDGNWWLDDEETSYPMLAEAHRNRLRVINVHKGFPGLLGPGASQYVTSRDLPKVASDWPRMRFVVYHSGYFPGQGIGEFLQVVRNIKRKRNIYAEVGSAFAVAFTQGPDQAAHLIGSLLKELGPRRIVWGTDSIWWGSPQWQIDAFKALTIPDSMREQYGYPRLTTRVKARILGRNAAKLYKIRIREKRCEIEEDQIARLKLELGGPQKSRSHLVYGPRTRRDFLKLPA